MIVTTRHLFTIRGFSRRQGFCRNGARQWARAHGIDWRQFVLHGIEEGELLATDDAFAIALVRWAHECAQRDARAH